MQRERPVTLDDEFDALVDSIPGFGGWFVADDGTPTVRLVDPNNLALAEERLATRIERAQGTRRPDGSVVATRLRAEPARYNFRQLRSWGRVAEAVLDGEAAAVFVDVNERTNRIEAGVSDPAAAARIAQALRARGVPQAAVEVEVVAATSLTTDSITGKVRPIPGGVQVNPPGCTMSFNASFQGTLSFITASHCTTVFGSISSPRAFFNWGFNLDSLGVEIYDPSPWQSTSDCLLYIAFNPGGICRYADAAVADYRWLSPDSVDFGYIARTLFPGATLGAPGSRVINSANPHFEILDKYYSLPSGIYVDRLGVVSGWTVHNIAHACTTEYYSKTYKAKLWCQYRTGVGQVPIEGDSGGPLWAQVWCSSVPPFQTVRPDGTACVRLVGIMWGRNNDLNRGIFSPISGVETDFGVTLGVRPIDKP
jgi:hypothetical protein